ncbi:amino acid ABC transporter permease [Pseudomonas putida]
MTALIQHWIDWFPELLRGFCLSLQVAGLSVSIGLGLGLLLALASGARRRALVYPATLLIELGRGAPVLIVLQFFYAGLPSLDITLSSYAASVAALAWSTGAYTSEIIRGGLQAVPAGQYEAARMLGLSYVTGMRKVILPQALRICLPALLGFALVILQATSLCMTVSLPELVSVTSDIGSETFLYMEVLSFTAVFYASVCIPATLLVDAFERRLRRHD